MPEGFFAKICCFAQAVQAAQVVMEDYAMSNVGLAPLQVSALPMFSWLVPLFLCEGRVDRMCLDMCAGCRL